MGGGLGAARSIQEVRGVWYGGPLSRHWVGVLRLSGRLLDRYGFDLQMQKAALAKASG
jgi:hypothetical protein